jgi:hypothetical protein
MTVKKSLENRIRGWFPQEPVLKAPLKTHSATVSRKRSFKVRRWLHGTAAFILSLLRQSKKLVLIIAILIGNSLIFPLLNYLSIETNNFVVFFWAEQIAMFGLVLLMIVVTYQYFFKKKAASSETLKQNKVRQSMKPNLGLWGAIVEMIALTMWFSANYLTTFVYPTPETSSTAPSNIPSYLGLVGVLVFLLGWGLFYLGWKQNKQKPVINPVIFPENDSRYKPNMQIERT